VLRHRIIRCTKCGHTCECPNCTFEGDHPKEKLERNKKITEMYQRGGITMKEIGKVFGLSQGRVQQILLKTMPPRPRQDWYFYNNEEVETTIENEWTRYIKSVKEWAKRERKRQEERNGKSKG
jgi:hypothetical protein